MAAVSQGSRPLALSACYAGGSSQAAERVDPGGGLPFKGYRVSKGRECLRSLCVRPQRIHKHSHFLLSAQISRALPTFVARSFAEVRGELNYAICGGDWN